jgi:outer membrane lipoprotein-sorting protein
VKTTKTAWLTPRPPWSTLRPLAPRLLLLILGLFFMMWSTAAAGNQLTGADILAQLKGETALIGSGSAVVNLVTENKKGDQRASTLMVFRSDDGIAEKQLVEYMDPADVRGTKFLSISERGGGEPEMWLYLPALGRERRIAGHMTKGDFMGTDFTYEEIGGSLAYSEDYDAVRLDDENYDGHACYVLDLTPRTEGGYARVRMWVWRDEMIPLRIQFFGTDGLLTKQLLISDLRWDEAGECIPHRITMSNELAGTKSIIEILEIRNEVDDDYFTLRYLRAK